MKEGAKSVPTFDCTKEQNKVQKLVLKIVLEQQPFPPKKLRTVVTSSLFNLHSLKLLVGLNITFKPVAKKFGLFNK